jgi:transposase
MELTDGQWELLKPLVEPGTPKKRRGRPWRETREVLEGVLWILRTGAQWSELPRDKFPPYQTCHRRFQQWVRAGTLVKVLRRLAEDLLARGQLDLAETFIDASFSGAKRGRCCWSNTPRQREQDRGNRGPPWSSCRRGDCKRFAS